MAQRDSGYVRKERSLYETPAWVTEVIVPYFRAEWDVVWEPACASGKMAEVLGRKVAIFASDLVTEYGVVQDFLAQQTTPFKCNAIVTNPPFGKDAEKFIRHGLELLDKVEGYAFMAMLLPVDFDSAKTRRDIFQDKIFHSQSENVIHFAEKIVLTSRITWFEPAIASPSSNHAWFIWKTGYYQHPRIRYYFRKK